MTYYRFVAYSQIDWLPYLINLYYLYSFFVDRCSTNSYSSYSLNSFYISKVSRLRRVQYFSRYSKRYLASLISFPNIYKTFTQSGELYLVSLDSSRKYLLQSRVYLRAASLGIILSKLLITLRSFRNLFQVSLSIPRIVSDTGIQAGLEVFGATLPPSQEGGGPQEASLVALRAAVAALRVTASQVDSAQAILVASRAAVS